MTEQPPLTRAQIVAALALLPESEANSVIGEARAADREQRKQQAVEAVRAWRGHPTQPAQSEPKED
jgi:hypothetical protein